MNALPSDDPTAPQPHDGSRTVSVRCVESDAGQAPDVCVAHPDTVLLDWLNRQKDFNLYSNDYAAGRIELAIDNSEGNGRVFFHVTVRHVIAKAMKEMRRNPTQ